MPTPELDDAELAVVIAALKEKLDRAGWPVTPFARASVIVQIKQPVVAVSIRI
jgi:hypothetical protein